MKFRSVLVEEGSGSAGNLVASRTGGRSFLRKRVAPSNPNTAAQSQVRASFTSVSQAYRTLTIAQRLGWKNLGALMGASDSLGQSYTFSGAQAHSSVNGVRNATGDDPLTDAPGQPDSVAALPSFFMDSGRQGGAGGAFHLTVHSDAYAGRVMVYATQPVSAGISSFSKSAYRLIGTAEQLTAGTTVISAMYIAKYGAAAAGSQIGVKLIPVSANGFKGGSVATAAFVGVTA